jgi:uncharacterized protein
MTRDQGQGTRDTENAARGTGRAERSGRRVAALVLVLCLLPCPLRFVPCPLFLDTAAYAQPTPPQLTAPVNDFANAIDEASERELERRIRSLQEATGDAVVVATVPTMQGYADINELARRMFENGGRGIGQKGKDNGALIVLALEERQVRIETGYDLEEFITDGFAGETIRQVMVPEFTNGEYGRGLVAGTTRIINRIAQRRGVELRDVPRERQPIETPISFDSWWVILLAWIVIMILSNRRRRGRRSRWGRGPWSGWNSGVGPFGGGSGGFGGGFGGFSSGGGGGGGFGGFGGGRSGGGGASGSW